MSPQTAWWGTRKDTERARSEGPLTGAALDRLHSMPTGVLCEWIDNSLVKIGRLIREGEKALLAEAKREGAALLQALSELEQRGDSTQI